MKIVIEVIILKIIILFKFQVMKIRLEENVNFENVEVLFVFFNCYILDIQYIIDIKQCLEKECVNE